MLPAAIRIDNIGIYSVVVDNDAMALKYAEHCVFVTQKRRLQDPSLWTDVQLSSFCRSAGVRLHTVANRKRN